MNIRPNAPKLGNPKVSAPANHSAPLVERDKEARKQYLRERISQLNEEISRLRNRKERASSEVRRLGDQIGRLEERINNLDGQIHSKGLEIAGLEGKRAAAHERKRNARTPEEKYRWQERIWALSEKIESKQNARYQLREERSRAVDSRGTKRERKQNLEYRISDFTNKLRDLRQQRQEAKEELNRLESPWGLQAKPPSQA